MLLAERWDVNEELVRFRSHNELFSDLLDAQSVEPVGKRLSFLVQEMHREANTIGSKANDAAISHLVVTGDTWVIRRFNDTGHLDSMSAAPSPLT